MSAASADAAGVCDHSKMRQLRSVLLCALAITFCVTGCAAPDAVVPLPAPRSMLKAEQGTPNGAISATCDDAAGDSPSGTDLRKIGLVVSPAGVILTIVTGGLHSGHNDFRIRLERPDTQPGQIELLFRTDGTQILESSWSETIERQIVYPVDPSTVVMTGDTITINYPAAASTFIGSGFHWAAMVNDYANQKDFCPAFDGDTRDQYLVYPN